MVKNKKTSKKLELDEKNIDITDKIMDPKIDFAFKELFGHNKTHFINLANAILHLEGDKKIESVTFLNLEMSKDQEDDRGSRLDVLAQLNDKSFLNIEMQRNDYKDFEQRSNFYFSRIYASQLKEKQRFHDLKKVILINILNFDYYKHTDKFHTKLIIVDADNRDVRLNPYYEAHFIEIPKFKKTCYDKTTSEEKWALFFKEPKEETLKELAMQSQEIAQAFESLEILSHNPKKRALYEARKKELMDIDNGMYVNRLEGMAEGEIKAKLDMAKEMKADGEPLDKIMRYTHLTKQQIDAL